MINLPLSQILVGRNTQISRLPWDSLGLPVFAVKSLHWSLLEFHYSQCDQSIQFHCQYFPLSFLACKGQQSQLLKEAGVCCPPPTPHPPFARHIFSGSPGRGGWDRLNFLEPFPRFQFPEHSGSVLCSSGS